MKKLFSCSLLVTLVLLVFTAVGCQSVPRYYTSGIDTTANKEITGPAKQKYVSPFTIRVYNGSSKSVIISEREDEVITVVPSGTVRTIYVNLDYTQNNERCHLFVRAEGHQKISVADFYFANVRYSDVNGYGFGAPYRENKDWNIREGDVVDGASSPSLLSSIFAGSIFGTNANQKPKAPPSTQSTPQKITSW